jgi:hypothetical protein
VSCCSLEGCLEVAIALMRIHQLLPV